jgi:hypothetical protein
MAPPRQRSPPPPAPSASQTLITSVSGHHFAIRTTIIPTWFEQLKVSLARIDKAG